MSKRPVRRRRPATAGLRPAGQGRSGPGPGLGLQPPSLSQGLGNQQLGELLRSDLAPNREPLVSRLGGGVALTVFFAQDEFFLDARSVEAVSALGSEIRLMVEPTITVDGHASGEGAEDHNLRLSKMRRELVVALLGAEAGPGTVFGGSAHGEADPLVAETGSGEALEEQRASNRRVEVVVTPEPFTISPEPEEGTGPEAEHGPTPPVLFPPGAFDLPFRPETDSERIARMLREPPPAPFKPRTKSLEELTNEALDGVIDKVLKGVGVRDRKRRARMTEMLRDGIKAGGQKAVEGLVDEIDLDPEAKEAIKKGLEAGFKQKL